MRRFWASKIIRLIALTSGSICSGALQKGLDLATAPVIGVGKHAVGEVLSPRGNHSRAGSAGEIAVDGRPAATHAVGIGVVLVGIHHALVELARQRRDILGRELGEAPTQGLEALFPLRVQARELGTRRLDAGGPEADLDLGLAKD